MSWKTENMGALQDQGPAVQSINSLMNEPVYMRFRYLLHMKTAMSRMSLLIYAVSPEPSLLANTK